MGPEKPGARRTDGSPCPGAYLRPVPRVSGGGGLVSTLPDMVALIRSLLPGGETLLKPDTIALMMTNQLPDGVWMRFPVVGELRGRAFGLAGGLILEPSPFDHESSIGELYWGGVAGPRRWVFPQAGLAGVFMGSTPTAFFLSSLVDIKHGVG